MSTLPEVRTITVELTHRCHRHCAFCYVTGRTEHDSPSKDELPVEVIGPAIASLVQATGCRQLQLSGGEPLLRRDLLPIIDAFRTTGASISMITDAAHLDADMARALAERKVAPIQPTLLSGDEVIHDQLRGAGAFRATTRAIATAVAAGIDVVVCMVLTKLNWQEAQRVAELSFALGARRLVLSRFCPAGAAGPAFDALMPDALHVRHAAEAASKACRALKLPLAAAITIPPCVWEDPEQPPLRTGVCSLMGPRTTVTIGPDGAVRSCSLSTRVVGNILSDSWEVLAERLWEQELAPMRDAIADECRACPWFSRCLGGCRMSAQTVFGTACRPDPLAPCACR